MIGLVKTTDLLLIGGAGLAGAFALGLFGTPEAEAKPIVGFPDFSFLGDIFAGAAGVPDLGASFFEGIAQQLAALQAGIGETGTTIINLPAEFAESATGAIADVTGGLSGGITGLTGDLEAFVSTAANAPKTFLELLFGGAGPSVPGAAPEPFFKFDIRAALLSGGIGAIAGLPLLGFGAIPAGLAAGVLGGFGAIPLSKQIEITGLPAAQPTGVSPGFGLFRPDFLAPLQDSISGIRIAPSRAGLIPTSPAAKAPGAFPGIDFGDPSQFISVGGASVPLVSLLKGR